MSVGDASSNVVTAQRIDIVSPDGVTARDTFPVTAPMRTTQQAILPTAIQQRFQAPVIFVGSYTSIPVQVATGFSLIVATKTINLEQQNLMQDSSWQAYIGEVSNLTRIPDDISSANYPFYTWNSLWDDDTFIGDKPWIAVSKFQVRNNSGSTQTFVIQNSISLIVNRTTINDSSRS